ncbi:MAG: KpsF/GutQ family sugar-phosphate isomerase [Planctomycetaceae bacterium]
MSSAAESRLIPFREFEQLREARAIVRHEAEALLELSHRLDADFTAAVRMLDECRGSVVVTGIGKAGLIGQKIAATLSSTGTRAHFLHPTEAMHGDLGRLHESDVLLALSNSGETEELCRLLPIVRRMGIPVIALTAGHSSTLGSQADVTVTIGRLREAGPLGLAPTTSTTAMLALGDALALVLSRMKGLTPQDFALFHPAGSLGRHLTTVGEIMRKGDALRIASDTATIRDVFVHLSHPGRRTGAVMLVDNEGRLSGLFTDSDLARLLEQRRDHQLDRSIAEVMTRDPLTIRPEAMLGEIVEVLSHKKVSELPVVDDDARPVGLVDITDVICQWPPKPATATVYRAIAS